MGGAVWRTRLMEDLGDQGDVSALIDRRSDDELAALMENLGGNCVDTVRDDALCFAAVLGWNKIAVYKIEVGIIFDAMPEFVVAALTHLVPAHVRHL